MQPAGQCTQRAAEDGCGWHLADGPFLVARPHTPLGRGRSLRPTTQRRQSWCDFVYEWSANESTIRTLLTAIVLHLEVVHER